MSRWRSRSRASPCCRVLHSERAIRANITIMRAFVLLRETLALHKELATRLADLEQKIESHDEGIRALFEAIRQLMAPPPRRRAVFVWGYLLT